MAGLLETLRGINFKPTPLSTGLLLAGANMMQAGGPSYQPQNFGTSMGAGLQGLLQGYAGAQEAERKSAEDSLDAKSKRALQAAQAQYYTQGGSKGSANGLHVVGTKVITENGKLKLANIFSDGTHSVLPYEVPNDMQYINNGNEFMPQPKKMGIGGMQEQNPFVQPDPLKPVPVIDMGNNKAFVGDPGTLSPEDKAFMESQGLGKQESGVAPKTGVIPIQPSRAKIQEDLIMNQNKAAIENRQKLDQKEQQELIGAQKTSRALDNMMRYLYPNGKVERDASGRLVPPKEPMILGPGPIDRLKMAGQQIGVHSDQASNLEAVRRYGNDLVLDAAGGSLGSQISNSDVKFMEQRVGILNEAQDVQSLYNAISDLESKVAEIQSRAGSPSNAVNKEPINNNKSIPSNEVDDLVKKYLDGK